jgi:hypothetical protein
MREKFDPLTLEDYMKSEPIEVKEPNMNYPLGIIPIHTPNLLDDFKRQPISGQHCNKAVGTFYELLIAGITGGSWTGSRNSSRTKKVYKPDVISGEGIYDSKSVSWDEDCKFQDFQMDHHSVQEAIGEYIQPKRKIFIPIFKYKLTSPWKTFDRDGTNIKKTLISTLCENTGFLLFLPFKVIYSLHSRDIPADCKNRYEGDKWDNETRFLDDGMRNMLINPEEILISVKLNPKDFEIRRTCLPPGVKISGQEIKPFPILQIDYHNGSYENWIEQINRDKVEELKKIITEKRTRDDYRKRREGPHKSFTDKEISEFAGELDFDG